MSTRSGCTRKLDIDVDFDRHKKGWRKVILSMACESLGLVQSIHPSARG